ncbi:glycoside hydrolase [Lentinula edodes]|uniref:Glycoside hydrolase n=1 Tax=Lentinula edodes TaxID=5353 RepID=A0A1Q3E7B8_LENED|nr:glycoside hydrolase [Lentinula edodes]
MALVENAETHDEWDWDTFKKDPELELWVIRVPNGVKPKHLENMTISLPESYDVWNVCSSSTSGNGDIGGVEVGRLDEEGTAGGGEEMRGLSCLLPRKKKHGELYIAPTPITRHLLISAQIPKPSSSEDYSMPTQNLPRFSYPQELLKHRFVAFGSTKVAVDHDDEAGSAHAFSLWLHKMDPGSIVAIDAFSLSDAMTATEIGEPRLDTGIQLENTERPQFDPLTPLLPEEICWIIDRSMAYETEWHASNPLAHTVFTLLYVHCLNDVDPDVLPFLPMIDLDSSRPLELITVILRAYTSGLLKSCSLAWNELSKGSLLDTEDWQSDKSDVSLLEGWPVRAAIARLDTALAWLSTTTKVPPSWQEALKIRVQFRRTILLLLNSTESLPRGPEDFNELLQSARHLLSVIRAHPCESISSSSPAHAAFDPYIARQLNTFLPVRVIDVPSLEQTCDAYERLLNGWEDLAKLSNTYQLSTWNQVGFHQSWFGAPAAQPAYIRSCAQTLFYDGIQIIHNQPQSWLVDRLFEETIGVSYHVFAQHWGGQGSASLLDLERKIIHTIIPHIRGLWNNPARRRRFLVKSIYDWHIIYDTLCVLVEGLDVSDDIDPVTFRTLNQFSQAVVPWRLASITEVILSGFQLELYHPLERPFAYWFAAQVTDVHLNYLDVLLKGMAGVVPQESPSRKEMQFQQHFLVALQAMSMAMFVSLIRSLHPNTIFDQWEQLRANLHRRYKWSFKTAYDMCEFEPVVLEPDFTQFLREVHVIQDLGRERGQNEEIADNARDIKGNAQRYSLRSPSEYFELAQRLLRSLISTNNTGTLNGNWGHDRMKLLQGMSEACQELRPYLDESSSDAGDTSQISLSMSLLKVSGTKIVDEKGEEVILRGAGLGGWMNMENFISGYPGCEYQIRAALAETIGAEKSEFFFDKFLEYFFQESDAKFFSSLGLNCIRLPFNYHHFEDDMNPRILKESGFKHLDRVIDLCSQYNIYTILDLHTAPGGQNTDWHSDHGGHIANFWNQKDFQDRTIWLWEQLAVHYKGNKWIAGYNPLNEPTDPYHIRVIAFYDRVYTAIRAVDPEHAIFFDVLSDFPQLLRITKQYEGEATEKINEVRYHVLKDQLSIYNKDRLSWSIWLYKDIGFQGMVYVSTKSAYMTKFADFLAKKHRLAVDAWGADVSAVQHVYQPLINHVLEEIPERFRDLYPAPVWKLSDRVGRLARNILVAEFLVNEWAAHFVGMDEAQLDELAKSFLFEECEKREGLNKILTDNATLVKEA